MFTQMTVQMLAVSVGYQMYEITGSALFLGLIGLIQFLPRILLTIPAGTVADKYDRRKVVIIAQSFIFVTSIVLLTASVLHVVSAILLLLVVFVYGSAFAMQAPCLVSLLPNIVSKRSFAKATATVSSAQQAAIIFGPAVAGLLYVFGPQLAYFGIACCNLLTIFLVASLRRKHIHREKSENAPESPFAGLKFIWKQKGILGAQTLDMVAVLFSGVTALLPIFATDVLHAGPIGFGILRSAPSVGAVLMSIYLAKRPVQHKTGKVMFAATGSYSLLTIFFSFSTSIYLSVAILILMGAVDMASVVIRSTYIQVAANDDVRGRVTAVNFIFIGASNQFGEFESGVAVALFGLVPAVVLGGAVGIAVTAIWYRLFPELRNLDKIE
jgi:MFS family permease